MCVCEDRYIDVGQQGEKHKKRRGNEWADLIFLCTLRKSENRESKNRNREEKQQIEKKTEKEREQEKESSMKVEET